MLTPIPNRARRRVGFVVKGRRQKTKFDLGGMSVDEKRQLLALLTREADGDGESSGRDEDESEASDVEMPNAIGAGKAATPTESEDDDIVMMSVDDEDKDVSSQDDYTGVPPDSPVNDGDHAVLSAEEDDDDDMKEIDETVV